MGAWMVAHAAGIRNVSGPLAFSDWKVAFDAFLEDVRDCVDRVDSETYGSVHPDQGLTYELNRWIDTVDEDSENGGELDFVLSDGNNTLSASLIWADNADPVNDITVAELAELPRVLANA